MSHNHCHSHHASNLHILKISFYLITVFMVVEAIVGYVSGSLALLADAGHMLNDSFSLGLAWLAIRLSTKHSQTALCLTLINALSLIFVAVWILWEAVERFQHPVPILNSAMLVVSFVGLAVNLIVAWWMLKGDSHNLNLQAALAHVFADIFGSVAVIVAGILLWLFGWQWADPLASSIVAVIIALSGINITKATLSAYRHNTTSGQNF
ncbi:hypothetical protein A4G19_01705 [Pasteurellaceae bacterium Macca]|nr:hypothetical protein [Pasteurellaceae bacterium Macca]